MKAVRPLLVIVLVLAAACGRTTLGNPLLDSSGADDEGDDGGDDSDDGARGGGGAGGSGGRNGGSGGTSAPSGGGSITGGSAGAPTGGSGGSNSGGSAGMAGASMRCGDGIVGPGEECDPGAEPPLGALEIRQGALRMPVQPIVGSASANVFYAYDSRSGHTGFEAVGVSRLYLYRWSAESAMSVIMQHGIDEDSSGITQPDASVTFEITGLPSTGVVALSDDDVELARTTPSTARADWNFRQNTDGGVIGGLPFPGSWRLTITPLLFREITVWTFVAGTDQTGVVAEVPLDLTQPVEIIASDAAGMCRADCTIPRCGDGRLDPGEVCDDGNGQPGDGCANCRPEL